MARFLPYRTRLTPRARQLRRDATFAERKLWHELLRELPEKFTRQKPLGAYIVDFSNRTRNATTSAGRARSVSLAFALSGSRMTRCSIASKV